MNSNLLLPKSFPIPLEDRDDFFSVNPKSFTNEQLNIYRKEIIQCMNEFDLISRLYFREFIRKLETIKLKQMRKYSHARIKAYNQGILLAEKAMKYNLHSSILPSHSFDSIDPKTLTSTQLQLYIQGITEEILYEKTLLNQFENEFHTRLAAYQTGLTIANAELSLRKENKQIEICAKTDS